MLKSNRSDKGKPSESWGRKAMGLSPFTNGYDRQAAEIVDTYLSAHLRSGYPRPFCF